MGTVTMYTAERMAEIEAQAFVSAEIDGSGHLILTRFNNEEVDLGSVMGPTGATGPEGSPNPPGTILEYGGSSLPAGYLWADGSVVLQATYPDLFAAYGTQYNTGGELPTQFRLPNRKGRVGVGLDAGQTEFDALGKTGGVKTVTLTIAQIPTHAHAASEDPVPDHKHWYDVWSFVSVQSGSGTSVLGPPTQFSSAQTYDAGGHTPNVTIGDAGGGGSHQNLQPFIALNYIIKT